MLHLAYFCYLYLEEICHDFKLHLSLLAIQRAGVVLLEKKKLQGDLVVGFQYIKRAYKKIGKRLFFKACSERTRGNGFKLSAGLDWT